MKAPTIDLKCGHESSLCLWFDRYDFLLCNWRSAGMIFSDLSLATGRRDGSLAATMRGHRNEF
jgi:hypothetical protein